MDEDNSPVTLRFLIVIAVLIPSMPRAHPANHSKMKIDWSKFPRRDRNRRWPGEYPVVLPLMEHLVDISSV